MCRSLQSQMNLSIQRRIFHLKIALIWKTYGNTNRPKSPIFGSFDILRMCYIENVLQLEVCVLPCGTAASLGLSSVYEYFIFKDK